MPQAPAAEHGAHGGRSQDELLGGDAGGLCGRPFPPQLTPNKGEVWKGDVLTTK